MSDWEYQEFAPTGVWLKTKRFDEPGTNTCMLSVWEDGTREWIEKKTGVTTVTHHSFLPPTHFQQDI